MSGGGVFGVYAPEPEAPVTPSEGPDSGWLDTIGAGFRLAQDEQSLIQDGRLAEQYVELVRDLQALGVPRDRLWKQQEIDISARMGNGPTPRGMEEIDRDAVWREMTAATARGETGFAGLPPTRELFERSILTRQGERGRDQGIVDRGSFVPRLIGAAGASFTDPVNLLTLPIGGGGRTLVQIFAREALVNSTVELLQTPMYVDAMDRLGEDVTAGDIALNVGAAALFGGTMGVGGKVVGDVAAPVVGRAADAGASLLSRLRSAADGDVVTDRALADELLADVPDEDLIDLLREARGGELTPTEEAAARVIGRQAEVDAVNPYQGPNAADAHAERLGDAISRVLNDLPPVDYEAAARAGLPQVSGDLAEPATFRGADVERAFDGNDFSSVPFANVRAMITAKEAPAHVGGYDALAYNTAPGRNAAGVVPPRPITQMTIGEVFDFQRGPMRARTRGRRGPDDVGSTGVGAYQFESLTLRENAQIAFGDNWRNVPFSAANQDRVAETLYNRVRGNRAQLGNTWAAFSGRGSSGGTPPVASSSGLVTNTGTTAEALRSEAAMLRQQALVLPDMSTLTTARFRPDEVDVDAELMQFKGGGDAFGVTERLQGVETWNPVLAGRTIVWEAEDGRRLIADGHQRLGLARRIAAADPGQNPMIDAIVMREADGWDAESVRTWAALKNIAEGSGTPVDAAKVFRAMGAEAAARYLPPRSALVRDAGGLARLGDDAFGAVVNDLVDPAHAAIVGRAISDPGTQDALVKLLIRTQPRTLGEANGIVQQGIAAGFTRETQADMFGELDSTVSLMLERSRVLDRGLAELRKMRQIFRTAAGNAETLGTAGNRIDVTRSAQEALDNEAAIDIIARLAWRAGPIKDALDRGARALADGGRQSDVVRQFVRDVRAIDVDELVRRGAEVEGPGANPVDGVNADAIGRGSDGAGEDAELAPVTGYSDKPDVNDNAWPSRAEIEAAGQSGFALFDEPVLRPFDDAAEGPGPMGQVDSIDHDLRAIIDEVSQDGPDMFSIDEGEPRALGDIFADFDRDAAVIDAVRGCL